MFKKTVDPAKQSGFGIIELMIAVTLSLILLAGISNIFLGSKKSYRLNEASSRVQENGRFAVEFLTKEMRQAGYLGCANPKTMKFNNIIKMGSGLYDSSLSEFLTWDGQGGVQGFNDLTVAPTELSNLGLSVGTNAGNIVAGTDAVILRGTTSCDGGELYFVGLGNTFRYAGTANLKIVDADACGIDKYSPVMVTDCATVDMFCVQNQPVSGGGGAFDTLTHAGACNTSNRLDGNYGPGSEVLTLRSSAIYIAYNNRGGTSLYWTALVPEPDASGDVTNVTEELVEGVVDMQLEYGEDSEFGLVGNSEAGVANFYDISSDVSMNEVVSVRLHLLVESIEDNVTQTPQTYTFYGTTTTPADNKLRRVFVSTIALRNRLK